MTREPLHSPLFPALIVLWDFYNLDSSILLYLYARILYTFSTNFEHEEGLALRLKIITTTTFKIHKLSTYN